MATPTAKQSDVLAPYSFVGADGKKQYGSMTNNKMFTKVLDLGTSMKVPEGYHAGFSTIRAETLEHATSNATVSSTSQIKSGKKLYSNGVLYTGTMKVSNTQAISFTSSSYEEGSGILLGLSAGTYSPDDYPYFTLTYDKLIQLCGINVSKIKNGTTVLASTGSYCSDGNATAKEIVKGKSAYNKNGKVTGTFEIDTLY